MTIDNATTTSSVDPHVLILDLLRWWPMTIWPQLNLLALSFPSYILFLYDQWQCDYNFTRCTSRKDLRSCSLMTYDNGTTTSHVVPRISTWDPVRWRPMTMRSQLHPLSLASTSYILSVDDHWQWDHNFTRCPSSPHLRSSSLMINANEITALPVILRVPILDSVCWWPMTMRLQIQLFPLVFTS